MTSTSVTISVVSGFSGPFSPFYNNFYNSGFATWAADVNARGGINGRKIVLKKVDDQASADGSVAACKEAASNGSFAAAIISQVEDSPCFEKAGVPVMVASAPSVQPSAKHIHAIANDIDGGNRLAEFMRGPMNTGGRKVGVIFIDAALPTQTKDGFLGRARQVGLNVVDVEKVAPQQASFVSELQRLRTAGAEDIALFVTIEVLGILRDAKALNYAARFTGANTWPVDTFSQAGRNLMDGIKAVRLSATVNSPAYQPWVALVKKYGQGSDTSADSMSAYGAALVLGKALELAGPNLTRDSFDAAFNKINGYDTQILPPVSWQSGDNYGHHAVFPIVCCNSDYTWQGLGPAQSSF